MIDASARSLQLPVFLAAQRSINTLFFREQPLGKVSPISRRVGWGNEMLLASWVEEGELRGTQQDNISPLGLRSVPRSALRSGFTQDRFCLLSGKPGLTLTTLHVARREDFFSPGPALGISIKSAVPRSRQSPGPPVPARRDELLESDVQRATSMSPDAQPGDPP